MWRRRGIVLAAVAALASHLGCSPPAECPALLEVRDQDKRTLDALAPYGDSVDPKQSGEAGRAFRDAAKKLGANAARVDAMKPSDLGLAGFAKTYATASRQIGATLDGLGERFEKITYAQEKFNSASEHLQAARAKMVAACQPTPAPAGCSEIRATLTAAPVDEAARKQIARDLESVKLDEKIVALRAEIIAALRDMDAARKELEAIGISAKASFSTTALTTAGSDIDRHCGKK